MDTIYRKALCIVGLAACLGACASPAGAETRIGIKGGASFASQNASGDVFSRIERPTRTGFAIGAVCEFPLGSFLWLRAEPMYVQKGSEIDWPSGFDFNDNTLKLDYLVLALNLKAGMDYGAFNPFVFAGPYVGYPVSDENVMKSDGSTLDADMQALDLGFDFGVGAGIRLNDSWWMTVDARYSLGLKDTDDNKGVSFRNRGGLVLAGLLFEL